MADNSNKLVLAMTVPGLRFDGTGKEISTGVGNANKKTDLRVEIGNDYSGYTQRSVTRGRDQAFVYYETSLNAANPRTYPYRYVGQSRHEVWDLQIHINSRKVPPAFYAKRDSSYSVFETEKNYKDWLIFILLHYARLGYPVSLDISGSLTTPPVVITQSQDRSRWDVARFSSKPISTVLDGDFTNEVTPKVSGIHVFRFRLKRTNQKVAA